MPHQQWTTIGNSQFHVLTNSKIDNASFSVNKVWSICEFFPGTLYRGPSSVILTMSSNPSFKWCETPLGVDGSKPGSITEMAWHSKYYRWWSSI